MSFPPLPPSKPDPIFSVALAARAAGPTAINGTIGMFMDEKGGVLTFPSVRSAITDITQQLQTASFGYGSLLGLPEFRTSVEKLMFGNASLHLATIASTAGTGAVALNLRLAKLMHPDVTIVLSTPSWINHIPLIRAIGLPYVEVPHVREGTATIDELMTALRTTKGQLCVLLQAGCHNPTGLDYAPQQWKDIYAEMQERNAITLLDLAYQGFHRTPTEDTEPIHLSMKAGLTTLVSWSASKNHSLYSERVGLALATVPNERTRVEVEGHYSTFSRGMHSASARFGQMVVARVQQQYKQQWLLDLAAARAMLEKKRAILRTTLPDDMQPFVSGNGMFALLPLTKKEIHRLRKEELVFFTDDGRINIAGIPLSRLEEMAGKIQKVRGL